MRILPLLLCLLLNGCASNYWIPDPSVRRDVEEIQYVAAPCGDVKLLGCFSPGLRIIQINNTQPDYIQRCVLGHEMKHAQGFRHEKWPALPNGLLRPDCGDASI